MAFTHPFQKICYIGRNGDSASFLLGAAGANIYSMDIGKGSILSTWPASDQSPEADRDNSGENEGGPPRKKRRTDSEAASSSRDSSVSIDLVTEKVERVKGQRRKPKEVTESPPPNISHLISTKDGKIVVAVSAEDKCVRVFQLQENGRLEPLSERCMPKRPCAIVFTSGESTLLVGDKFGDAYALPLLSSDNPPQKATPNKAPTPFTPSASELTVHTKGNLEALRQQREQKLTTQPKTGPAFEHDLILGHVSLLTDLISVDLPFKSSDKVTTRSYILTCDRDEHIRVSRGLPQAHIIETYCLGHKDFVTKLCVLPWQPDVLVSGSGEPALRCYSWPTGEYLYDLDCTAAGLNTLATLTQTVLPVPELLGTVVSGIWAIPYVPPFENVAVSDDVARGFVVVAMEGLPWLFSYSCSSVSPQLTAHSATMLPGNALDVTFIHEHRTMIVSVDTVHNPGSVKEPVSSPGVPVPPSLTRPCPTFSAFRLLPRFQDPDLLEYPSHTQWDIVPSSLHWVPDHSIDDLNRAVKDCAPAEIDPSKWKNPSVPSNADNGKTLKGRKTAAEGAERHERTYSPLGECLYGLENLRKKGHEDSSKGEKEDGRVQAEGRVVDGRIMEEGEG